MDLYDVKQFLMWCAMLNGGVLIFSFLFCAVAGDLVYKLHSRWFPISRESFNGTVYSLIGLYKILFIVFNLIPWLTLELMK